MPNGKEKQLNFVAKVRDPVSKDFKPLYIAPDATNVVQGDVFLSDAVDSDLDAAEGMTAATPKAVHDATKNKLDKTTSDTQNVKSEVVFDGGVTVSGDNFKVGEYQADGTFKDGVIPLKYIPQGALERLVTVQNETERFKLTTDQVQVGDSVKQIDTDTVYMVVDQDNLDNENGYVEYSGGTARRIGTETIGSPIRPVYIDEGYPTPVDHVLGVDVPVPPDSGISVQDGDFWTFEDDGTTRVEMSEIIRASNDIAKNDSNSSYWNKYEKWMQDDHTFYMHMNDGTNGAQQTYQVRIIGMNNDIVSSDKSQAGLTFMFKQGLKLKSSMSNSVTNVGGWKATNLRTHLNSGVFYNYIPEAIKSALVSIDKISHNLAGNDILSSETSITSDKMWIPSYSELVTPGTFQDSIFDLTAYPYITQEGSQYDFFKYKNVNGKNTNDILKITNIDIAENGDGYWWERSATPGDATGFLNVQANGYPANDNSANAGRNIVPCFCLNYSTSEKSDLYLSSKGEWEEIDSFSRNEIVDIIKAEIPIASSTTLGGIKVGNNLNIDSNGTLNASGGIPYVEYTGTSRSIEVTIPEFQGMTMDEIKGKLFLLKCPNMPSSNIATTYLRVNNLTQYGLIIQGLNTSFYVSESYTLQNGGLVYFDGENFIFDSSSIPLGEDYFFRPVSVSKGGTGRNSITYTALLYGNGAATMGEVANNAGALYKTSSTAIPTFGTLPVAQGGTGRTSFTSYSVPYANTSTSLAFPTAVAGALYKTSTTSAPVFGVLPVAQGGTGTNSYSALATNLSQYMTSNDEVYVFGMLYPDSGTMSVTSGDYVAFTPDVTFNSNCWGYKYKKDNPSTRTSFTSWDYTKPAPISGTVSIFASFDVATASGTFTSSAVRRGLAMRAFTQASFSQGLGDYKAIIAQGWCPFMDHGEFEAQITLPILKGQIINDGIGILVNNHETTTYKVTLNSFFITIMP